MGTLKEYIHERIKDRLPETITSRIHKDWLDPLFGEAVLREELAETWKEYKRQTRHKPYTAEFNQKIKLLVRKRDKFNCQYCGKSEEELGKPLSVHHINYNKKDSHPCNLISICGSCHAETNGNRLRWEYELYGKMRDIVGDEFREEVEERLASAHAQLKLSRHTRG